MAGKDQVGAAMAASATDNLRLATVQPAAAVVVMGGERFRFLPVAAAALLPTYRAEAA